jgi:non-specific serine/threonine protein kinase
VTARRPLAEMLAALQQKKLSLADLVGSLNERGPVQSPLHRAELNMLDEALAGGKLDEKLHRLLAAKLREVQERKPAAPAPKPAAGGGDKTVVAPAPPAGDRTVLNPAGADDRTRVNPGAGGEATVLNPAAGSGAGGNGGFDLLMGESNDGEATQVGGAETTGFRPSEPATASRTGGTGTGGPSTSTWKRVAADTGPEREVHAGDVLKDRFYLEKEVGRGGMGIVFKARDERKVEAQDKNPWVAVKILNPEFRKHPQALVALQRESRKAQQLTHDNILRVYDFDKDQTVIYMTMEYVDGGSLKDVIKKHPSGMPFARGWPIIEGLARGLGRAHRDNIVHSDFKPGNVMMTSDLVPKLFDLGIARAAQAGGESKGETTVFDAGELGALTPAYASLEMIQGQPPQLIDDIYALGITAYEILTGKHPFNKKNAEQAMKEGMKPPVVPGLTRRQRTTLERSIAFKRSERIPTCDAFIEGLRPRTRQEQLLPMGIAAGVVLLVSVVALGPGRNYLREKRVESLVARYQQGQFADPAEAVAAFTELSDAEAALARQKGAEIQDFFFKAVDARWNPEAKPPLYQYPEAARILQDVKALFPDSARVAQYVEKTSTQKEKLLSSLRDEVEQRTAAGLIYEDKPGNVVETLTIVATIDPNSEILKNKSLPLRYAEDVNRSIEAKNYERASVQVATATRAFPGNETLRSLAEQVKTFRETELAQARQRELQEKMTAAQAREELVKLAGDPTFSADWQVNVTVAMSKLAGDTSPDTQAMKDKLAEAYAQQVAKVTAAKQLASAQLIADSAMKMFPGAANVRTEVAKLDAARKAYEAEQAKVAALARVEDLKSGLVANARAGEVGKALRALGELRTALGPNDPFVANDAPRALADAYLKLAERQAAQNRFAEARRFVAEGLKLAPANEDLKARDREYAIEASVAALMDGAQSPAKAAADQMKQALGYLESADPARASKVSGQVQNDVLARLTALTKTDPAAAGKGKAEGLKVFPQHTQLASLVIPEMTTAAAPAAATPSLPQEARQARRAPRGTDSCSPSFSKFGKSSRATCQDDVAGAPGPKLVVVPNPAGGVMAITKYEITAGQFNAFCSATGKCKPQGGNDALPRTGVSLALAKAYAAWLTETTGFTYRLPTDGEWQHAASADGAGPGDASNFNCVVMSGSSQIKGGIAVPTTTGAVNAWGLVNIVGNAAEWTENGSARGGHFNVPTARCAVDWRESGSDSDTVGLRLVREMG